MLEDKVTFANADCLRLRAAAVGGKRRREMLEQARKSYLTILQNPSSGDMKETVEKMVEVIDQELKKGIFN
ncbi:hypothetical protein [Hymenobacter cellulosilyticus]|uniref:Uncharacterized protein n=1 Tax=Hymenobacter cellulosilyticus TaxID=2932248 RepID=A0A8T9QB62_9BACT|nr:hypothetical protein [Hymenobacter cellulosilyticus]UOQ74796.1 hypothetical protein MUN79_13550 [Hymenobacter cellulosilyticus]